MCAAGITYPAAHLYWYVIAVLRESFEKDIYWQGWKDCVNLLQEIGLLSVYLQVTIDGNIHDCSGEILDGQPGVSTSTEWHLKD